MKIVRISRIEHDLTCIKQRNDSNFPILRQRGRTCLNTVVFHMRRLSLVLYESIGLQFRFGNEAETIPVTILSK